MKQSPATIDIVQKTFNLTEEEKLILLEAAVGEGIFFAGQKHVAMRVVASYTEDQIITTAPEEVLKNKKSKRNSGIRLNNNSSFGFLADTFGCNVCPISQLQMDNSSFIGGHRSKSFFFFC